MLFGWFRDQINETMSGLHSDQLDTSYKQGMSWFIFSEVMFFGAFFGALFYARMIAVPWLDGASNNVMTGEVLWPQFVAQWPLVETPGGTKTQAMGWYGLPLMYRHLDHQFDNLPFCPRGRRNKRTQLTAMLGLTIVLGMIFLYLQALSMCMPTRSWDSPYNLACTKAFYLLTGFHGHVTLGTLMLIIMFLRV